MASLFSPTLTYQEVEAAIPNTLVIGDLGAGGQGVALKVTHGNTNRTAALKIYGPQTTVVRVDLEIEKLTRLNSPFVVRLLSHGTATIRGQACRYAVLEYIEGTEVTAEVGNHPPDLLDEQLRRLLSNVASGIRDMWSLRVVHRDIKPANLMVRSDGSYVILDLGLAKHLDESTITQIGMTCGTFGYMSPEQSRGRRSLTFRSDLFSLGLVAYEVATGRHPFHGNQNLVGKMAFQPLAIAKPNLSSDVTSAVARLLEIEPLRRPHRSEEIISLHSL